MPKMLSWAKKISGRSSPKKSGHEPEVDKDIIPEKKKDADGDNVAVNTSSLNTSLNAEKEHSTKERRGIDSVISRETPSKEYSSDCQPSPPKQHSPSKTPSPEKSRASVKKTSSFAKRFGSFRIPGLDRKSPDKSSRSKSRSPELETTSKDNNPSKIVQNEPSNTEASESVLIRDKNLSVQKVNETISERVTENGSKHEKSMSCQEPVQKKHSETDRLSNTNGSDVTETLPQPEENSNTTLSKFGRRSISEKLYGEVIKEFDKMRTTRSRVMTNEFGSVREENESLTAETQKENSVVNSSAKDSKLSNSDPSPCHNASMIGKAQGTCEGIENIDKKPETNTKESSLSRGDLEKRKLQCGPEKETEGENEPGLQVNSPSDDAQYLSPKPVASPLRPSETPPGLHIDKEKQSQSVTSSSLVTEINTPQHSQSDTDTTNELTPKASPLTRFFSSIVTNLSPPPVSDTMPVPVKSSPSQGDKVDVRANESIEGDSELTKKNSASENTVETLAPSAGALDETGEKSVPCLPKSDTSKCLNDNDNMLPDTQVLETTKSEVVEDSSSTVISQTDDVCESPPTEMKNIENNSNPVPSVRLSKLPKLSSETTNSAVDSPTTPSSHPSPVNHLPDLSEDCKSPSSDDKDGVKDPLLNEPLTMEESVPVHIPETSEQRATELSLQESSENTDFSNMSLLTESKDDQSINKTVSPEELDKSSKTENVEDAEKLKENSPSSSDEVSIIKSEVASIISCVHTDPEVSVISCYNLDESLDASKSSPVRTDTCDSTDASPSPSSVKDDSSEVSSNGNVVSPTAPQRTLHEKLNKSSEKVNLPLTVTLRPKENGINKELSRTFTESGEYPSSGEGGSLPASPSAPRRRKKSNPVPVARSLQTFSPTSSGNLTLRETQNNRERSSSQSKAPPRPPMPASVYSPSHLSSSARSSATVSPKTPATENGSISSQEIHKHSIDTSIPQVKNAEPYNPFDSDEDTETTDGKPGIVTSPQNSARKISLNPFDSDEEEDKRENNNNQALNKKPHLPPASYNPFDEDDDEGENEKDTSFMTLNSTLKSLDDSIASPKSQSSVSTHESTSKNPFDDDEDEESDLSYNGTPLFRQSIGRQSLAVRSSSPFQREGVRASLPNAGRGRTAKKKRQAPLPPGYRPSPATTPLPPRSTMMRHGESSTSLFDGGSLRKNSMTSGSSLSLSSPKRTPPPRPPPPKGKSVSMAQL